MNYLGASKRDIRKAIAHEESETDPKGRTILIKKINDAKHIKDNITHFSNAIGFCVGFHEHG